jgi:hypothetical protein
VTAAAGIYTYACHWIWADDITAELPSGHHQPCGTFLIELGSKFLRFASTPLAYLCVIVIIFLFLIIIVIVFLHHLCHCHHPFPAPVKLLLFCFM